MWDCELWFSSCPLFRRSTIQRASLVLSTLAVGVAFSTILLALTECQAVIYPNSSCLFTPLPGNLTNCACEQNAGNGALAFACEQSWQMGDFAIAFYCAPGSVSTSCSLGGMGCGNKRMCTPPSLCNTFGRSCVPIPALPCDAVTVTGCSVYY